MEQARINEIVVKGHCRHSHGPPLTPAEWVFLNPDDRVCVERENENVTTGMVDIVAPDASIFWIWLDGGRGRVAIHQDDDVSVWFEEARPWFTLERLQLPPGAASVVVPWQE